MTDSIIRMAATVAFCLEAAWFFCMTLAFIVQGGWGMALFTAVLAAGATLWGWLALEYPRAVDEGA